MIGYHSRGGMRRHAEDVSARAAKSFDYSSTQDAPTPDEIADQALDAKAAIAGLLAGLAHSIKHFATVGDGRAKAREFVADVHRDVCSSLRAFVANSREE
jgi:hypothetical protein